MRSAGTFFPAVATTTGERTMETLIAIVRGLLGLGPGQPKDDWAGLPPHDLVAYWTASETIDAAEREGNVDEAYEQFGIKSESHWEAVQATVVRHHGSSPEFSLAATTASFNRQVAEMAQPRDGVGYQIPAEYLAPVDGVTLDKLILAKAKTERLPPAQRGAALAKLGLDPQRLAKADQGWSARMGGKADPMAASILSGLYHTYDAQVRATMN
ncbi:MAG: hypothetical protein AAGA54_37130 [Myxococcota bacterium]